MPVLRALTGIAPLIDLAKDRPASMSASVSQRLSVNDRSAQENHGGVIAGIPRLDAAEMNRQAGQRGRIRILGI